MQYGPFLASRHVLCVTHYKQIHRGFPGYDEVDKHWIDSKPEWKNNGERNWYGTDCGFPDHEIYAFTVTIDGKVWKFDKRYWSDRYDPNSISADLSRNGKLLAIDMSGSDGAGSYEVI